MCIRDRSYISPINPKEGMLLLTHIFASSLAMRAPSRSGLWIQPKLYVHAYMHVHHRSPHWGNRDCSLLTLFGIYRNYIGIFPRMIKSDFSCQIDLKTITEQIEIFTFGIQSTQLTYLRIRIFKPIPIEKIEKSTFFRTDGKKRKVEWKKWPFYMSLKSNHL